PWLNCGPWIPKAPWAIAFGACTLARMATRQVDMTDSHERAPWSELFAPALLSKLLIVLLGVWINAADALVTTTIMPSVAADIGGYAAFSWAVAGFLIGSVVASASAGRLAEIFGLGRASGIAGVIFVLGCVAGALAAGMELFL